MIYRTSLPLLAAALAMPAAAFAQTTPAPAPAAGAQANATPTVGATVYDPQGVEAGTIDSITAQAIVISTGTAKVAVPPTAVGPGAKGLTVSLTKEQLNAAGAQANAQAQQQLQAQLVPGAQVRGSGGIVLGTIKSTTAELVTLTTPKGDVSLPRTGFGMGPEGLIAGVTQAELDAAVGQSQGAATATEAAPAETPATTPDDE